MEALRSRILGTLLARMLLKGLRSAYLSEALVGQQWTKLLQLQSYSLKWLLLKECCRVRAAPKMLLARKLFVKRSCMLSYNGFKQVPLCATAGLSHIQYLQFNMMLLDMMKCFRKLSWLTNMLSGCSQTKVETVPNSLNGQVYKISFKLHAPKAPNNLTSIYYL